MQVSNLSFFHRKSEGMNSFLEQTLVDGELVIDEHKGMKIPRFLIYDIIKFQVYVLTERFQTINFLQLKSIKKCL